MSEALPRRSYGVSLRSNFLSKKPHFFRIMHPALLKDGKPEIPERFLRKYGKHLSSVVFLKVPSGAQWRVELMKRHDEALLQGGWQEFCEFYSIGYGHLLLFRYEGDSHFHVLIFDMTASEIEYPSSNATHDEKPNNNNGVCQPSILKENHENDVSVEILDDFPASQTTKEEDIINITSSEEEFSTNEASSLPKLKDNKRDVSVQSFHDGPPSHNTRMKTKLACLQPNERRRNITPPKTFNTSNHQSKGIQGTGMKFEKSTPEFRGKKFYLNHAIREN
ncbi:hypothetical protein VitviT2T_010586 [Vitis vinifera]|uniref:TF-B3 domain-containing protein n=1 Tax=Vitis vinifera TaxID=29760 RepID=A0ABY9C9Q0_VITVI|nr:hypothetical protein VitviT2T_010586 [Vitis vinifera]